MPQVSVVIPAYNQAIYLDKAIQSVLQQSYQDFELVVIDDGSTDQTKEVVLAFHDKRLAYIYQENKGLAGARNSGIRSTTAPLLIFLDSDDVFLPNNLALLSGLLNENPQAGAAAGQAIPIDSNGIPINRIYTARFPEASQEFLFVNPLHVGSVMVRRFALDRVGFFDENLRACEDWDLWLRLSISGYRFAFLNQAVSQYRLHPAQMTRDGGRMRQASFAMLEKTFENPDLPEAWKDQRHKAFAFAHLRSAANAYHSRDFSQAQEDLRAVVRLDPSFTAVKLARRLAAIANHPKISEPVEFLTMIYANLPAEFIELRRHSQKEIANFAAQKAFESYQCGNFRETASMAWRAIRRQPMVLKNMGFDSMFIKSLIQHLRRG